MRAHRCVPSYPSCAVLIHGSADPWLVVASERESLGLDHIKREIPVPEGLSFEKLHHNILECDGMPDNGLMVRVVCLELLSVGGSWSLTVLCLRRCCMGRAAAASLSSFTSLAKVDRRDARRSGSTHSYTP